MQAERITFDVYQRRQLLAGLERIANDSRPNWGDGDVSFYYGDGNRITHAGNEALRLIEDIINP